jgi:hypothetical protein
MPITSRISSTGLSYTTGQIDEATYNRNSGYRKNLVLNSQNITTAYWVTTDSTIVSNVAVAPDGTFTAGVIIGNRGATARKSAYQFVGFSWQAGQTYTYSVYLKSAGFVNAMIWFDTANLTSPFSGAASLINLTNGTFTSNQVTVVPIGNGWYRCSATATAASLLNGAALQVSCGDANGVGTAVGDGVSGVYVWGYQLELNSQPTIYEATDASGLPLLSNTINKTDANGNFYTAGTFDEATYNPASTFRKNLIQFSQQINTVFGTVGQTLSTSPLYPAPDGTQTAYRLSEDNSTQQHYGGILSGPIASQEISRDVTCTWSVYLKKGLNTNAPDWMQIAVQFQYTTAYVNFNLTTGTIGVNGAISANMTPAGNEWYRCSMTFVTNDATRTSGVPFNLWIVFTNNSNTTGRLPNYTGSASADVLLWGPQFELNNTATIYEATGANAIPLRTNFIKRVESQGNNYVVSDYDEVTYNQTSGFLLNLLSYSDQFTVSGGGANAFWTPTNINISPVFQTNAEIAPDGTRTATLISASPSASATSDTNSFYQQNTITRSTNINYCISVFVKRNRSNIMSIYNFFTTPTVRGSTLYYNFSTDTVTAFSADGGGITPTIFGRILYPNGWVRLYYVVNDANSGLNTFLQVRFYPGDRNVLRNDDSTFYWGAQVEIGSFPSDYVATGANRIPLI